MSSSSPEHTFRYYTEAFRTDLEDDEDPNPIGAHDAFSHEASPLFPLSIPLPPPLLRNYLVDVLIVKTPTTQSNLLKGQGLIESLDAINECKTCGQLPGACSC